MSAKSNPLDRATISDWRAWIIVNAKWILTIAAFLGYNVLESEPELPPVVKAPDVAFSAMEFQQLVTGFQESCKIERQQWQRKNKR